LRLARREFVKIVGLLASAALIKTEIPSKVKAAEASFSEGRIEYYKSTCKMCVNFCGINVKVQNGVLRAIYTDERRAPYFNVGLCPKGVAGIWNTYNPYRLKNPLKRTNPRKGLKEDPGWVEISWEEAFNTVAERLRKIRQEDPRKLVWYHGHGKYLLDDEWMKAFTAAFGTPNMVHRTTVCEAAKHVADEITWGGHGPLPDLEYCNYLINMGGNYFEAEQWSRWLDHATLDAKKRGMKLVVVEPRLSNLAAKADEWVPIKPGRDILFLLAMANVLIENGFVDKEFLVNYTNAAFLVGDDGKFLRRDGEPLVWDTLSNSAKLFTDGVIPAVEGSYKVGGKSYRTAFQVIADYVREITPESVADECGVPAEQIRRVALEFGKNARIGSTIVIDGKELRYRPVCIHTFRGLAAKEHGTQNTRAMLLVLMLVGAIDAVGGYLLHKAGKASYMEPSKCEYPPSRVDLKKSVFLPHATHDVAQQALPTVLEPEKYGIEYKPEVQMFFATNRPFSASETLKQFDGLEKTFNVIIDIAMNETAWYADIVFPDKTYLEAFGYYGGRWVPHARHYTLHYPIVNAYGIPYQNLEIMFEIAKRAGFYDDFLEQINKKFKFKDPKFEKGKDYDARAAIEILWRNKTGQPIEQGIRDGFYGKFVGVDERYLKEAEAKFKGPGKLKMHFYCEELVFTKEKVIELMRQHEKIRRVFEEWYESSDVEKVVELSLSPYPRKEHAYPTPHLKAGDYPLYLITFKRMYRNQSGYCNINPILNQVSHNSSYNDVWINSETARKMGIKEGERVTIESRVGRVEGIARVTECVRPDTIAVSYHYGQWSPGFPEWARKGTWINQLLEYHPDLVSGMNSFNDTKVKLSRA
jgi:anaerobic selenocysteine-containing dehydrogenase